MAMLLEKFYDSIQAVFNRLNLKWYKDKIDFNVKICEVRRKEPLVLVLLASVGVMIEETDYLKNSAKQTISSCWILV